MYSCNWKEKNVEMKRRKEREMERKQNQEGMEERRKGRRDWKEGNRKENMKGSDFYLYQIVVKLYLSFKCRGVKASSQHSTTHLKHRASKAQAQY